MANFDFKDSFEVIEWFIFKLFLLATFLGAVSKLLDKEFGISKRLSKWKKQRRK